MVCRVEGLKVEGSKYPIRVEEFVMRADLGQAYMIHCCGRIGVIC